MRRGNQVAGTRRISFCVAPRGQRGDGCVPVCVYRCASVCSKKNSSVHSCVLCMEEVNVNTKSQRENGDLCKCGP